MKPRAQLEIPRRREPPRKRVRPGRAVLWMLLALAISAGPAGSQTRPGELAAARSVSGQFIIFNHQGTRPAPDLSGDQRLVKLEPALLSVMCERVKQALTEEIGPSGPWRGKIYLTLRAAHSAEDEIGFLAEHFRDGWVYRLDLPNPVDRTRLVRAVVQAVLLEQANRTAGARSAELPLWLSEGFLRHVLATRGLEVILPPPQMNVRQLKMNPVLQDSRRTNVLTLARLALGERQPLTLEELSWPKDDQLAGSEAERYQLSAHLFVGELLRFEDGRECFRRTLAELPNFLNWQMAFLRGFKPHFARQLDVEKWWSLQMEFLTGRDERGLWTLAESWNKLDQLLRVPIQVRRQKQDLPTLAEASLTSVIAEWDYTRHGPALQEKLQGMDSARLRMAAELLPLLDEYRHVLGDYLRRRENRSDTFTAQRGEVTNVRLLVRATVRRLEELEVDRQELKPKTTAPVAAAKPPAPSAASR